MLLRKAVILLPVVLLAEAEIVLRILAEDLGVRLDRAGRVELGGLASGEPQHTSGNTQQPRNANPHRSPQALARTHSTPMERARLGAVPKTPSFFEARGRWLRISRRVPPAAAPETPTIRSSAAHRPAA